MLPVLFHTHHSLHVEDIPFWLDLAAEFGDPILELGCGTGRVLIPLARAGYRMIGIDHDVEMLDYLRVNLDDQKQPCPSIILGDIGHFNLAMQFSLILLPCNTFSSLTTVQRQACLERVQGHLKTAGIFSVSLPNPELLRHLPAQSAPELEDEFIHPKTGNPVQVSSTWRRTSQSFIVTWIYDQLFPDGTVERVTMVAKHQLIPVEAYLNDFQAAGLKIKNLYGDFDRSTYGSDSPSLIIVAAN